MKKVVMFFSVLCMLVLPAVASEPSNPTWTSQLNIVAMYVGDYNVTNGRVYIACSDGKNYWFNLGSELAKTLYSNAMTAFTAGKKVQFGYCGTLTTENQVYRMIILY